MKTQTDKQKHKHPTKGEKQLADTTITQSANDNSERQIVPRNPAPSASQTNVHKIERVISLLSGAGLIVYGIRKGGWSGISLAITGGGLAFRGTGVTCVFPQFPIRGPNLTFGCLKRYLVCFGLNIS